MTDVSDEEPDVPEDKYWLYDLNEDGNRVYEINIHCWNNPNLTMADLADL